MNAIFVAVVNGFIPGVLLAAVVWLVLRLTRGVLNAATRWRSLVGSSRHRGDPARFLSAAESASRATRSRCVSASTLQSEFIRCPQVAPTFHFVPLRFHNGPQSRPSQSMRRDGRKCWPNSGRGGVADAGAADPEPHHAEFSSPKGHRCATIPQSAHAAISGPVRSEAQGPDRDCEQGCLPHGLRPVPSFRPDSRPTAVVSERR